MTRTIIVGLDGSPESRAAAEWAAREATLRGLPVKLLHVWEPVPEPMAQAPLLGAETHQHWSEKIPRDFAEGLRLRHPGVEVTAEHRAGRPSEGRPSAVGLPGFRDTFRRPAEQGDRPAARRARHRAVRRCRPGRGLRAARPVRARRHGHRRTGRPPQSRLRSPGGTPIARLAPLTDDDVHDLITSPRCAPLLFGSRGGRPVDLPGLEQLLLRLSRMASDLPQLAEADFNPVLATPGAVTVLDARLRLLPRRAQDPYLRRLR